VQLVYLTGPPELISERLASRRGHFFNRALLHSQLATLEPPSSALLIDISDSPGAIVESIVMHLGLQENI
jgi:gluconokinase